MKIAKLNIRFSLKISKFFTVAGASEGVNNTKNEECWDRS